ncbi:MarR family transcriptional regulator (plasmid) [Streptomyces sp. NBC_00015]|uniref:winged helix DNA-binding protein n=1 Tax=Streptomyces sp. NBC_00015 TaxID=2903611 RepID=UPI003248D5C1
MTTDTMRMTRPTVEVLRLLLDGGVDDPLWGARIGELADLGKSTVSQILARLTALEWVTPREEAGSHPGRPARVFYTLTEQGRREAKAALAARSARIRRGGSGKTTVRTPLLGPGANVVLAEEAPVAATGRGEVDHAALLNHLLQEAEFVPASDEEVAGLLNGEVAGLLAREALDGYRTIVVDTL